MDTENKLVLSNVSDATRAAIDRSCAKYHAQNPEVLDARLDAIRSDLGMIRKRLARQTFKSLAYDERPFVRDLAKRNVMILEGELADLGRQSTSTPASTRQSKAPAQPGLEKEFYLFLISIILLGLVVSLPRISKSKPGSEWHSADYHEVNR